MKRLLLIPLGALSLLADAQISIDGTDYAVETLMERQLGPGTLYRRLRLPDYPLNINMIEVDVTNPGVRVETTQANDVLFGTERLVEAAARQSYPGHRAIAGANANFWCVTSSYPYSDLLLGTTFNANLRNGKIITETNCHADQWDNGPTQIGEFGISADGLAYSAHMRFKAEFRAGGNTHEIMGANKVVRDNEIVMFNSYFGSERPTPCADMVMKGSRWGFDLVEGQATEVFLDMAPGAEWSAGRPVRFVVSSVADNTSAGTLGSHDLMLVARGDRRDALRALAPGTEVELTYTWTPLDGTPIEFANMVGGNGQVMVDGELTDICNISGNCALVYSKTGYGSSADHRKMFVFVIDKSTDPVYGTSAGCTSAVMCQIARHYGCTDLTNVDSGGSAQLYAMGTIVNRTTEGTPRAVANGMFVYNISPEDDTEITSLAFDEYSLSAPVYSTYTPRILGYNSHGALVDDNVQGFTLSAEGIDARCEGMTLLLGGTPGTGTLTASLPGGATVSRSITVVEATPRIRIREIVIDDRREYPVEVESTVNGRTYRHDPAIIDWELVHDAASAPCTIDADGVLRGVTNGTALLRGTVGDFSDEVTVSVEIPDSPSLSLVDADSWSASGTQLKVNSLTSAFGGDGLEVDFKVTGTRGPSLTLTANRRVYSLPEAFELNVDPGTASFTGISLYFAVPGSRKNEVIEISPELVSGQDNILRFEPGTLVDLADLANFPLTLKNIKLTPASRTGEYSFSIKSIRAIYAHGAGIDDVPAAVPSNAPSGIFDLAGRRMPDGELRPGLYIKVTAGKAEKILVR